MELDSGEPLFWGSAPRRESSSTANG